MNDTFASSLSFGVAGESVIARWLRSRGNAVLPAYEKLLDDAKGPRVFMTSGTLVSPDFLAWNAGKQVFWIEAKHKNGFTWHRGTREFVTGIDLPHYNDYCRINDESPWPVWLLFLHEGGQAKDSPPSPAGLYANSLTYLREHIHHTHANGGKRGMIYWSIQHLIKLAFECPV